MVLLLERIKTFRDYWKKNEMQVENTPSLARKKSKVHEDDLISSFSDCTSGTYQIIWNQGP